MPPYRLQTLLQIRERAKEDAEQAFSAATQALVKERTELKRLEEDLARRKRERKAKVDAYLKEIMAKGSGASGMNTLNRFEDRLRDEEAQVALEIEVQKEAVRAAEKLLEQRRVEMAEAARELKSIEKHKEKWAAELKAGREMREELAGEEIGNALFLARQRK